VVDEALAAIKNLVATVDLTANQAGATVLVDGEAVGTTPLTAPLTVDLGRHTIALKKARFELAEQTIETPGGSTTAVLITLHEQRHVGHLLVTADESATIVVDGSFAGEGRYDGQLAPGAHEVRVTKPGKMPYEAGIDLRDGETRTIQVTLENERHGTSWPWIVGGVAVLAGAAVGGYFLFQPHDEKGPAPTGVLGTVYIQSLGGR
jgi:hypothetical protein